MSPSFPRADDLLGLLAYAISGERDRTPDQFRQVFSHRFERVLHIALPFGAAQVQARITRAFINRELNRRDGRRDTRVVGDLAVFERNVEINTYENSLPRQVEVANGKLGHTSSFLRLFEQMTHFIESG